ncbi:sugar ABC transporter substrate-binding protein [Curtobacterium sp. MCBD17_040]|uniref:ABC transporter substrate-binding protein n=1 Tax=Curtobacterium sp. MCBD17_040 TaxID=2175674 RepID=UPI000DA8869D|nr:sugar ABC transporter substrate-binding protein [Curtobacterium sp. MCBD17_040]WIB64936.1 sugar ABC transporter substrate-binding protein [Curtobacterium sp. MCBD17_040]
MNDQKAQPGDDGRLSRRGFVGMGAAIAGGALLSPLAVAGVPSGAAEAAIPKNVKADLVLSTWDIAADLVTYAKFAAAYKKTHPGVNIKIQKTPGGDFNQWFTTQLSGGSAPDIVRVTWQSFGRYAENGGLIDLSKWVPARYGKGFQKSFWQASLLDGKPHAIPQHTDTFATYYRKDVFAAIGEQPPASIGQAWSLSEFHDLLVKVKKQTGKYGMVYGFGGPNTAYRWLPFLYMMGGRLLDNDLKKPMINTKKGIAALDWFQGLYNDGLIPKSNTIKASNDASTLNSFTTGQVGVMLYGDWLMGDVGKGLDQSKWDVTYMPKGKKAASDLGGNLLGVSKSSKHPDVAADFIKFVCNQANMEYFCENDLFLPIRTALDADSLHFRSNNDQMKTFVEQVATIPTNMAKIETSPQFNQINEVLADQLDLCFIGTQTPKETAKNISDGISRVVG